MLSGSRRWRTVARHPRDSDQARPPLVPVRAPLRVTPPVRTMHPHATIRNTCAASRYGLHRPPFQPGVPPSPPRPPGISSTTPRGPARRRRRGRPRGVRRPPLARWRHRPGAAACPAVAAGRPGALGAAARDRAARASPLARHLAGGRRRHHRAQPPGRLSRPTRARVMSSWPGWDVPR